MPLIKKWQFGNWIIFSQKNHDPANKPDFDTLLPIKSAWVFALLYTTPAKSRVDSLCAADTLNYL